MTDCATCKYWNEPIYHLKCKEHVGRGYQGDCENYQELDE